MRLALTHAIDIQQIITDNYVSIEQGSGALKVTPAHDFNDFEIGKRHNLEYINIFEKNGSLNHNTPKEFIGLDRFEARKLITKILKEKNLLEKVESIKNTKLFGIRLFEKEKVSKDISLPRELSP